MTSPECIGFIDLRYNKECSECEYAAMCAYIVVTEKWDESKEVKDGNASS